MNILVQDFLKNDGDKSWPIFRGGDEWCLVFKQPEDLHRFLKETELEIHYHNGKDIAFVHTAIGERELKKYLLQKFNIGLGRVNIAPHGVPKS